MGAILLRHPLVQLYLLYVGVLGVAFLWDYWRNLPAAPGGAAPPPCPRWQGPVSVSRPGRRTDKEVEPTAGRRTWGAPRASVAAPISGKRREHHAVTP